MSNTIALTGIDYLKKSYIGGQWVDGQSGRVFQNQDPYEGTTLAEIPLANQTQIKLAFEEARTAQKKWAKTTPEERREVLTKALNYLQEHKDEIIQLIVCETGGTYLKAEIEFSFGIGDINEAIKMVDEIYKPKEYSSITPNKVNRVYRLPLGVITSITPYNFPFNMATRTIFPAIALGNSVVHKPSIQVGMVGGQIFAKAFEAAGLPEGVFNSILTDSKEGGDEFFTNPNTSFVSFTGSTAVGEHIEKVTAGSFIPKALELGGNNPLVILGDANVDYAVDMAIFGKFMHNGQICAITNRIIIHEDLYDQFVSKYVERVKGLAVGDPKDPATVIGPVINEKQANKIMSIVDEAKADGIKLAVEGGRNGNVISPFVFIDVANDSKLARTEIFGPVAMVIRAKDDDDAIKLANDIEFGLSSAIITSDLQRGERLALEIESGTSHVNDIPAVLESNVPFGGVKKSGTGRFGTDWIIEEFTTTKWVSVQKEAMQYPF
ncbi:aldehyde dehydrogenase family protein [Peribacillus frigoritolerans]|uniref:aldehyde dehydrogenase family protein n=1 Tax=Peribacillus frigoritolerans TaxID=450367 RepID=UPI002281207C|nr:aldehyde dehydrogenase family protein [Peribacillus frigoritolerans]MCY9140431.1 aldehyde dehydrogenase family protein [Peribacillus frigoritolerans]